MFKLREAMQDSTATRPEFHYHNSKNHGLRESQVWVEQVRNTLNSKIGILKQTFILVKTLLKKSVKTHVCFKKLSLFGIRLYSPVLSLIL